MNRLPRRPRRPSRPKWFSCADEVAAQAIHSDGLLDRRCRNRSLGREPSQTRGLSKARVRRAFTGAAARRGGPPGSSPLQAFSRRVRLAPT